MEGIWSPPRGHKGALPWGVESISPHVAHPIKPHQHLYTLTCQKVEQSKHLKDPLGSPVSKEKSTLPVICTSSQLEPP